MKTLRRRTNRQGVQLARRRMSQARRSASRGLFAEQLEDRRLLSGVETPYHNAMVPIDVTRDWVISPRDALLVINELNDGGARALDTNAGVRTIPIARSSTPTVTIYSPPLTHCVSSMR